MPEKAAVDGLAKLRIDENDMERVEKDARLVREPEGLPVQLTESWQSSLLSDPKNKYDPPDR